MLLHMYIRHARLDNFEVTVGGCGRNALEGLRSQKRTTPPSVCGPPRGPLLTQVVTYLPYVP